MKSPTERNAKYAAQKSRPQHGEHVKTALISPKKKGKKLDESRKQSKPLKKNIKTVRPATALCVMQKSDPKIEALNILPNSYLPDVQLSKDEEIHKVVITSIGIIK